MTPRIVDGYWTLCSLSEWWQSPRVLYVIFCRADPHSERSPLRWSLVFGLWSSVGLPERRPRQQHRHPFHARQKGSHWSPCRRNSASTNTLFRSARGSFCRGRVIKLPSPPFRMLSWLGKKKVVRIQSKLGMGLHRTSQDGTAEFLMQWLPGSLDRRRSTRDRRFLSVNALVLLAHSVRSIRTET